MNDLAQALSTAIDAARAAGEILRNDFYLPGGPRGGGSHATADDEAEGVIRERLLAAFPWNYLGEETLPVNDRDARYRWLVDPNDGTSAYLKGWRGSAVSIALLRDCVPVLGVVYAFCYPDDVGDLIAWAEGCPLTRNGEPLSVNLAEGRLLDDANPPPFVFVSQAADKNPSANAACVHPARQIALPSIAYRLARVAIGDGVAGVSLNSPCHWDFAAGHALLRGAGGVLVNEVGTEVTYSQDGTSFVGNCFGGCPDVVQELRQRDWQRIFQQNAAMPINGIKPLFDLVRPQPGRAVRHHESLTRAQGCLLGQLAGDSLGGLIEFTYHSTAAIQAAYPQGLRDHRDGGSWGNLAGQPTDDSEMALMLARSLLHHGRYDRAEVLDAYLHWWPQAWDRGSTLSQALSGAGSKGTDERFRSVTQKASQTSQANGSLMRISPLGIFYAGRPDEAADQAREDSRLTHPHQVCQDACAVFVAALATTVGNGGSRQECYQAALAEAERSHVEPSVLSALQSAQDAPPKDFFSQQGWVLIALQNAFYQLLHASNAEQGIVDTVMRGGDTDTNAAIVGALLGAACGRQAIPNRWILALQSCRPLPSNAPGHGRHPQPPEFWPVDALELSEALLWMGQQTAAAKP